MFDAPGLFDPLMPQLPKRFGQKTPRDYQREDYEAFFHAVNKGNKRIVIRWATGLGKSVLIAMLAGGLGPKRVMVLVDVGHLAVELWREIQQMTGETVGIYTGEYKEGWMRSRIVVATVQSLYHVDKRVKRWGQLNAADQAAIVAQYPDVQKHHKCFWMRQAQGWVQQDGGGEFYRNFNPADFSAIVVDECESSIADKYSETFRWFTKGNEEIVAAGASATPIRSDGQGMGVLYDYAHDQAGPLNRDINWGRDNGWLVRPRQGFVHVSIDMNSLKLVKGKDGERDYADEDLVALFDKEEKFIELAKGIDEAAKGEPAIVVCPNDINFAKVLAWQLCAVVEARGGPRGAAEAVYGKQGRHAHDLMKRYKVGQFPYIVACKKLEKGFDADIVRHVFLCRKTKSRRLYEQVFGRGVRPLYECRAALDAAPDAAARVAILEASAKPFMTMWDMVGIEPDAKDLSVIDILFGNEPDDVRVRAKQNMLDSYSKPPSPMEEDDPDVQLELDLVAEVKRASRQVDQEKRLAEENAERERRARIRVDADIHVEVTGDLRSREGGKRETPKAPKLPPTIKQIEFLVALGVDPYTAANYGKWQAKAILDGYVEKIKAGEKKVDYSLVRHAYAVGRLNKDGTATPRTDAPKKAAAPTLMDGLRINQYQVGMLRKLNYRGPMPETYDVANSMINQLQAAMRKTFA